MNVREGAGLASGSTQSGNGRGLLSRSLAGGAEEVNGASGSAGTKRLDSSGARAQSLPRSSCGIWELAAGPGG